MTALKIIVSAVAVASTMIVTMGTSAQAGDWRGHGYGGYRHGGYHAPAPRHYGHYNHPRRDRSGERIATGVAIGVGALILGSIIANQNRRHYGYGRY